MITSQQGAANRGWRECGRERGFAMLFAVLTSSVLLSVGLSIFNLTIKELALSSSGRESQAAFYAADSGIECGLYWDIIGQVFATSSDGQTFLGGATCAGQAFTVDEDRFSNFATTTFSFAPTDSVTPAGGVCALVTVSKRLDSGTGIIRTEVVSRGYNVGYDAASGDADKCTIDDDLKVERALKVSY